MKPIGIFGGTFDPIHSGHLSIAQDCLQALELQELRMVPCQQSPLRGKPNVSATQRLAMLKLAIEGQSSLVADDRELKREGPSFSVDSLAALREEYPDTALCFILGMDAFVNLSAWKDWQTIFKLAHLIVVHRPGSELQFKDVALQEEFEQRQCKERKELTKDNAGKILLLEASRIDISATQVRALIAEGKSAHDFLPDSVWQYIKQHRLYQ